MSVYSEIVIIKRLRPIRRYLVELNNAGIFSPGNIEYNCIMTCINDIGCQNPFTGNALTFNTELDIFLSSFNKVYSYDRDTEEKIDTLCNAL